MIGWRIVPLAALLAAPALPLHAAGADCAIIQALLSDKASARSAVSVGWTREGIRLMHRGKPMTLPAFTDCEIDAEPGEQRIDCKWTFYERQEALERVELARRTLATCLPSGWTEKSPDKPTKGDTLARLAQFEAMVESEHREVWLTLDATEFFDDNGGTERIWVSFEYEGRDLSQF